MLITILKKLTFLHKLFIVSIVLISCSSISLAATIEVTAQIGEPGCDLVEAIRAANDDTPRGGCIANNGSFGDDLIVLNFTVPISEFIVSNIHNVNNPSSHSGDIGANGLPRITSNIRIIGRGDSLVTIKRSDAPGTLDFRLFTVSGGGSLTLRNISLQSGKAVRIRSLEGGGAETAKGGAIFNSSSELIIIDCEFRENSSVIGGAISIRGGSTIIRNSLFLDNSVARVQVTDTTFVPGVGGAIAAEANSAVLSVFDSTFSGNTATDSGGAISTRGGMPDIVLTNTTITNNTASNGGGINFAPFINDGDTSSSLRAVNSIISGNEATSDGDEVRLRTDLPDNKVFLTSNLIGNMGSSTADALFGDFDLMSNVLATNDGDTPTALSNILLPLADNGGRTQTHALADNSPAIDAATEGTVVNVGFFTVYVPGCRGEEIVAVTPVPPFRNDQRGIPRPNGSACDIGSFELELPEDDSQCFVIKAANENVVVFCF